MHPEEFDIAVREFVEKQKNETFEIKNINDIERFMNVLCERFNRDNETSFNRNVIASEIGGRRFYVYACDIATLFNIFYRGEK